ncbi:MAG TPA: arsinothricin resistance N-acetyltransferase ArsN1 family B [Usitatibacter sp.]|nr:arsinothricin resistance N-acetyltransferase ArsN1 family B [Usitatibacter sp.]
MTIRAAAASDAPAIARIYNHYVAETIVSFEEEPVAPGEIAARIAEVQDAGLPFLVADSGGTLQGYAYAGKWKARRAYRFSVEVSVYLDRELCGRGIGSRLYEALFAELQARGVHAVIGGIALPNDESVALHEKFGMVKTAHFREVGFKFGRWIDVGYWERVLGQPAV